MRLDNKTIQRFLNILHNLAASKFLEFIEPIGDKDVIVEVDESKFGLNKYHAVIKWKEFGFSVW